MSEKKAIRVKKRIKIRKKINTKKQKRIENWKAAGHNIFTTLIILFSIIALYLLLYGLILEPNIPRHFYGPGDFKESILFFGSLLIIAISYFAIKMIRYKPLNFEWWNNIRLFIYVRFDLDKYVVLKSLGVKYHIRKKKKKKRKSHSVRDSHAES